MTRPRVLMWHAFGDADDAFDPHRMFVPVEVFARQLDMLMERRFRFLELEGFLAGLDTGRWPPRSVLVTIDDGYVSTLTEAAPLLAARRIPAVMFALAGKMGGTSTWMVESPDNPLLDRDGLRALESHGIRVEAHGWDHTLLPGLPSGELYRQVAEARATLSDVLGRAPLSFAYPSGEHDEAARRAVRAAGYSCAFGVQESSPDRWAIGRIGINSTDTDLSFRLKMSAAWPIAYRTVGKVGPVRRTLHRMVGSNR